MHVNFTVKTVSYSKSGPLVGPECFEFHTTILFDNSDFDGQIPVSLKLKPRRRQCPKPFQPDSSAKTVTLEVLNIVVIAICGLSFLLCARALVRGQKLRAEAVKHLKEKEGWVLTWSEKLEFFNCW